MSSEISSQIKSKIKVVDTFPKQYEVMLSDDTYQSAIIEQEEVMELQKEFKIQCEYCNQTFNSKEFSIHAEKCNKQQFNIKQNNSLQKQKMIAQIMFLNCQYCQELIDASVLKIHEDQCDEKPIICEYCLNQSTLLNISTHKQSCKKEQQQKQFIPQQQKVVQKQYPQNQIFPQDNNLIQFSDDLELAICQFCKNQFSQTAIVHHQQKCSDRKIPCPNCQNSYSIKYLSQHLTQCKLSQITCNLCKSEINHNELEYHQKNKCLMRICKCEQCSQNIIFSNMEQHNKNCRENSQLQQIQLQTRNKSTIQIINNQCYFCKKQFDQLSIHQQFCELKPLRCEKCNQIMELRKMRNHNCIQNIEQVGMCGFCFQNFPVILLEQHYEICQKFRLSCQHCKKMISKDQIQIHQSQCLQLKEKCSYCQNQIKKQDMASHLQKCTERPTGCNICGQEYPFSLIEHHEAFCYDGEELKINQQEKKCQYCGINFGNYKEHENLCGIIELVCEYCGGIIQKAFEKEHYLICMGKKNHDNLIKSFQQQQQMSQQQQYPSRQQQLIQPQNQNSIPIRQAEIYQRNPIEQDAQNNQFGELFARVFQDLAIISGNPLTDKQIQKINFISNYNKQQQNQNQLESQVIIITIQIYQQQAQIIEFNFKTSRNLSPSAKMCAICHEEFQENERVKMLACSHRYHPICINDWSKKQKICPQCRKPM